MHAPARPPFLVRPSWTARCARHAGRALLLSALLAGGGAGPLLLAPAPAQAQAGVDERINAGEIVVSVKSKHPIYTLSVIGAVDGTADQVWDAITTYDRYEDFLPLVTDSAVRKRNGPTVLQYIRMTPPWPFHMQWMLNECQEDKARGNLSWKMADGNVKLEYGFWQLTPMSDGRTRLQYHLTVDPWMDFVPSWVVEMATNQVMPDVIKGVRKRVAAKRK